MIPQKNNEDLQNPINNGPSTTSDIASLDFVNGYHNPLVSDSEGEAFRPSEKGLLVIHRLVNGVPTAVLIRTDADINHRSIEFCTKARICTAAKPYKAQLASKATQTLIVTKNKVITILDDYTGSF